MGLKRCLLCVLLLVAFVQLMVAVEAPKGSITIDRISQIKYPSNPAWSPDGKMVAFLWDSWGKQDLLSQRPPNRLR